MKCDSLNEDEEDEKLNRDGMYIPNSEKKIDIISLALEKKRNNVYAS